MLTQPPELHRFTKISVIGLGYIGLPTAAVIAARKINVIGVDINQQTVDVINQGKIHIIEPELDIMVHTAVSLGYLKAVTKPEPAEAFLIAVPTPFKDDHQPDLTYIQAAANAIAPVLNKGNLVILESTSPVGTTQQLAEWLALARPDLTFPQTAGNQSDIRIAYCPERVLPGHVLRELVQNDRIIGGISNVCSQQAQQLYKIFVEGDCLITDARTAEMCKLTENSFRDLNIAFANELSMICDQLNINVWELIKLANHHPRVNILRPGPGVGGHCIAVDPWFIVSSAPNLAKLISTARHVNDSKPTWVIEKLQATIALFLKQNPAKKINDLVIACFGLAFKADIDDLRESPAVQIVQEIVSFHSGKILVVEPNIENLPVLLVNKVTLIDIEQGLAQSDIKLLLVDHYQFKQLKQKLIDKPYIIDSRGIWQKG